MEASLGAMADFRGAENAVRRLDATSPHLARDHCVDGRDEPGHDVEGAAAGQSHYWFNMSNKSSQPGLEFTISWAFQARGQCFMFDSRWMAAVMNS